MKYKLRNNYTKNPEEALLQILKDRGVEDVVNFIRPSSICELNPHNLKNIVPAANNLLKHLRQNSKILFIVDADADGFTSSAILWLYIKHIFPKANLDFTVHEHKQHGLDDKIDWISNEAKWDLVLVPDAGSYDVKEHKILEEMDVDVICLDHHEQLFDDNGNPVISTAKNTIIVNNQLSPEYTNKSLCGAGIVYKFCEILDEILGIKQAQNYLDLAALGEIADVMNKTNTETNYIMQEGLKNIKNKGFQTLIEAQSFSLKDKAKYPYTGLTTIDIAFYIAPMINAITRVGTIDDKRAMFYCFIEPDKKIPSTKRGAKPSDTETAAEHTARVGANAKAKQNKIKERALDLIDFKIQKDHLNRNNTIIVELKSSDDIPQEMTGLIAMAIVSKYRKPCLIGRKNERTNSFQGSARSDGNFIALPSLKVFLENSNYFQYVAGHNNAFGFSVDYDKIQSFIDYVNKTLSPEDFENCYIVDYILNANEDNSELLFALAEHPEYFGNQIEEISIVVENISLMNIQVMGTDKSSIKISQNGIDYVKFKDTKFIEEVLNNRNATLTVKGKINLNEWGGRTTVQCFIDDYELKEDKSKYDF